MCSQQCRACWPRLCPACIAPLTCHEPASLCALSWFLEGRPKRPMNTPRHSFSVPCSIGVGECKGGGRGREGQEQGGWVGQLQGLGSSCCVNCSYRSRKTPPHCMSACLQQKSQARVALGRVQGQLQTVPQEHMLLTARRCSRLSHCWRHSSALTSSRYTIEERRSSGSRAKNSL
jgi:hypothetical protein